MKKLILILATVFSAAGTVFANVTVRTDGAPIIPGTVVHLSWQRPSPTQTSDVDVSYDLGSTWTEIAADLDLDSMDWTIPAVKFEALQFRVRLEKLQQSTYQIPTSYRRPGSTTSKAWSPNGDTLITIETTDSTCHVLRTDLINGRTEKIWGTTTSSGWGRISIDLSCAYIALTRGGLLRIDLRSGAVVRKDAKIAMMEIVEKADVIAVLDSNKVLHCVDKLSLESRRSWSLGAASQTSQLFVVGERIVVTDTYWHSLIFTIDKPYGIWSSISYYKFGNSDTLVASDKQFIDIRTHAIVHELPFFIRPYAISKDERYVVTNIDAWAPYTGYWFVDLQAKTQFKIHFTSLDLGAKIAFTPKDSCLYVSRNGRTIEVRVHPERNDTLTSTNWSTSDFLPNGEFAFVSDVLVNTFTMDSMRYVVQDRHVSQVVPSPDPRFVVIRRSGRVELLDQKTGLETWITELSDAPLTYKWSVAGDRALITDGRTLGILVVTQYKFQKIFKAESPNVLNNVVSTKDLSKLFWVVASSVVYAWSASEQNSTVLHWEGPYRVKELWIDEGSDILSARFAHNYHATSVIRRTSVERLGGFTNLDFHGNKSVIPVNIQYHALDTSKKIMLIRETVSDNVLRLSAWNYDGEFLWSLNTKHPSSPTLGPLLLLGSGRFVIRTTTEDHVYDTRTGTLVWSNSERVLAEVADDRAYIVLYSSNSLEGHAALDLSSFSRNERVSVADSLQFKNTVVVSEHAILFRSDSSWVVMINSSAVLSVESTLYSEILQVGTVTHVTLSQDELLIHSAGVVDGSADIHICDLQGRLLFTINGVNLSAGLTQVLTSVGPLPRYAFVQIMSNDRLLYRGTIVQ